MQKDPLFRYKTADRLSISLQRAGDRVQLELQFLMRKGVLFTSEQQLTRNTPSAGSTDLLNVVRATRAEIRQQESPIAPDSHLDQSCVNNGHDPLRRPPYLSRAWPERCASCEYDLSGHSYGCNCPECGTRSTAGPAIHGFDGWSVAALCSFRRRFRLFAISAVLLPAFATAGVVVNNPFDLRKPSAFAIVATSLATASIAIVRIALEWMTQHAMYCRTFQSSKWSRFTTHGILPSSFMIATLAAIAIGASDLAATAILGLAASVYIRIAATTEGSPVDSWRPVADFRLANRSVQSDRSEFLRRLQQLSYFGALSWRLRTWFWFAISYLIAIAIVSSVLVSRSTVSSDLSWAGSLLLLLIWAVIVFPITVRLTKILGDFDVYIAKATAKAFW